VPKVLLVADINQLMIPIHGNHLDLDASKLYTILVVVVKCIEDMTFDSMKFTLNSQTFSGHQGKSLTGIFAYPQVKPILCEGTADFGTVILDQFVVLVRNHHVIAHKQQPVAGLFELSQVRSKGASLAQRLDELSLLLSSVEWPHVFLLVN